MGNVFRNKAPMFEGIKELRKTRRFMYVTQQPDHAKYNEANTIRCQNISILSTRVHSPCVHLHYALL